MLKFIILVIVLNFASSDKIPSFVKLCKRNDPELSKCFANSMRDILPHLREGVPQLGLPRIEPLFLETVTFSDDAFSKLQIRGRLFNASVYNVSNFEIKGGTVDLEKFHFTIDALFPSLRILSICETKGKVMLFELDTVGTLDLNITNIVSSGEWSGEIITKNGKQYGHLTDGRIKIKSAKVKFYLSDVFKGNSQLTETFNTVVNENMDALYKDFLPLYEEILGQLIVTYSNLLYDKYPLDELYPPS